MFRRLSNLLLVLCLAAPLCAAEPVDDAAIGRIRDEGLRHSQIMQTLEHLSDAIGPRLTGSASLKVANDWTRQQFAAWGLADARLEGYDFGRGWHFEKSTVRMLAPRIAVLSALPKAWTPGTAGPVRGEAIMAKLESDEDLAAFKGKLAGKVVFLEETRFTRPGAPEVDPDSLPAVRRHDQAELDAMARYEIPAARGGGEGWKERAMKRYQMRAKLAAFLIGEKAVATVSTSPRANGILGVQQGGIWEKTESDGIPGLVMSSEHFNRVKRLLEEGTPVELEVDVDAGFEEGDGKSYNTLADIPGSDPKAGYVMAGAHLDSWHTGDGATDDGAGVAVVMEAARILKTIGAKPRRSIRFALWSGEEQGYFGSLAYVHEHLATRPEPTDSKELALPPFLRKPTWPIQTLPEHAQLQGYFNYDGGGGKIVGISAQENAAAAAIFRGWIEPLRDLGVSVVTMNNQSSTDHVPFDDDGLPAFCFEQDDLDYETRTHHTQLDTFDHVKREDLMQSAVVMASFLYQAAQRPEPLPRKPLPKAPRDAAGRSASGRP
jgi:carboxypeptidase Q